MFQIATLNVRGLRSERKQQLLKHIVDRMGIHVVCLQETHFFCLSDVRNFERNTGFTSVSSFGARNARGVTVALSPSFRGEIIQYVRDDQGRVIVTDIVLFGKRIKIANVYAPVDNQERNMFFESLDGYFCGSGEKILIGDFNCVLNEGIDSQGGSFVSRPWKAKGLKRLVNAYHFVDVWEKLYGTTPGFTFHAQGRSVRLDRCYVHRESGSKAVDCEVTQLSSHPVYVSDHSMVTVHFEFEKGFGRLPNRWRLNTNLLGDEEVTEDVRKFITEKKAGGIHSMNWWEEVKRGVVCILKRWGRKRAQERREAMYAIRWGLRNLRGLGLETATQLEAYKELQEDLSSLLVKSTRPPRNPNYAGQVVMTTREVNTANRRNRPIALGEIQGPDGVLRQTQQEIEETCVQFYADLYERKEVDQEAWKELERHVPSLEKGYDLFGKQLTVEDITEAMKALNLKKSPGSDGLPVEFYRLFWDEIAKPLSEVFNLCLEEGKLPESMRLGVIKLLCKDENKKRELKAWRPVTLLNTEYKILAKALQLKLGQAMDSLLSPVQGCAAKGRQVHAHLIALRDMITYCRQRHQPLLLLNLDQEKAFDRVSHEYMLRVLTKIGLPPLFLSYIGLLYRDINSVVEVNGKLSRSFPVLSGVRQGCPLSPLLYVLSCEPFVRLLAYNPAMPRATVPGINRLPTAFAFADDITVCTTCPSAVAEAMRLMELYAAASGAKLNKDKSAILKVIGEGTGTQIAGIPVVERVKILGVEFTKEGVTQNTWTDVLKGIENIKRNYDNIVIGYRGRRNIIRSEMCSRLWYVGACSFPSRRAELTLTRSMMSFLWQGRPEKVKRVLVQAPPECGGLNIFNVKLMCVALAISYTCKVIEEEEHVAKQLALYSMGILSTKFGQSVNHLHPKAETPTPFYKELVKYAGIVQEALPGEMIKHMTTKKIYETLFYACKRDAINTHVAESRRLVLSPLIEDDRADLAWELSHNVLPVATRLYRFRFVASNKCATCEGVENHQHIFYECIIADAMWRKVAALFSLPRIEYTTVHVCDPIPVGSALVPSFCLLATEVKFQLWASRNRKLYGGTTESLRTVTFYVRLSMQRKLQQELDVLGADQFKRRWKNHWKVFTRQNAKINVKF